MNTAKHKENEKSKLWPLIIQIWMIVVLMLFLLIRILGSNMIRNLSFFRRVH
jgi:hypothetical protein